MDIRDDIGIEGGSWDPELVILLVPKDRQWALLESIGGFGGLDGLKTLRIGLQKLN